VKHHKDTVEIDRVKFVREQFFLSFLVLKSYFESRFGFKKMEPNEAGVKGFGVYLMLLKVVPVPP